MKKNLKRTLAKVMAVALTVALAGTAAPDADAAKKIKLSSKSITVAKGKTKKVTIKNVKKNQVKKLTVKSSKTKVATVKKSGKTALKVTGKKAGSAKITVSVTVKGKKKATKLTLKVKVQNQSTPTPVETAAPTAAATATAPATTAPSGSAAPGTSGNPADPGTSGNPADPGTSGNPATAAPTGDPTDAPTQAPAENEVTEIKNLQLGGKDGQKATYFKVEDGTAHLMMNSSATYGSIYTYFDVVVPEGSSVNDIKKISFNFEAIAGDLPYKNIFLIAGSTANVGEAIDAFPAEIDYDYKEKTFANVTDVGGKDFSFDGAGTTEGEFEVDSALLEDMDLIDNTIRFCLYVNLDGQLDGVNTEYKVGNIRVYSTKDKPMADGNDAPGATIDKTADIAPVASLALGVGSIALTETTTAEVAVSNTGVVGDIVSVEWSSSDDEIATVTVDEDDATKAVVSAVAEGTAEISAKITAANGNDTTVTREIKVTEDALEDFVVEELTDDNAAMGGGCTKTAKVADGKIVVSADSGKYDDVVEILLDLPAGTKISDYAGVQFDLSAEEDDGVNKYAIACLNMYNYTESNEGIYGNTAVGEVGSYDGSINTGSPATVVVPFDFSKIDDKHPIPAGKIALMIRIKDDKSFGIANVKLLAKLPADE